MKKMILTLVMMMTIAISATAMTRSEARHMARVQTDRMAVELSLSRHQYGRVFDINYRYVDNPVMKERALSRVLTPHQFNKYMHLRHAAHRPVAHRPATYAGKHHRAHKPAPAPRTGIHYGW